MSMSAVLEATHARSATGPVISSGSLRGPKLKDAPPTNLS